MRASTSMTAPGAARCCDPRLGTAVYSAPMAPSPVLRCRQTHPAAAREQPLSGEVDRRRGGLSACLPVRPKLLVKVRPALFREEDPATLELQTLARPGNRLCKPVRPFHVEVDIVRSPDDQGGCFQRFQAAFDFHRVRAVESCEEALKVARALLGA